MAYPRYPDYDRLTIAEVMPAGQNTRMIFYFLQQLTTHEGVPWKNENLQVNLDTDYTQAWSGYKYISPIVERQLGENTTLTTQNYQTLANIAWIRYWRRWKRLWDLYLEDYDPLQNYNMTETMTNDQSVTAYGKTKSFNSNSSSTRTDDLTHTRTDNLTELRTDNLTESRSGTDNDTKNTTTTETPNTVTHEDIYGFNSQDGNTSGEIDSPAGANRTREGGTATTSAYESGHASSTGSTLNTGTQTVANTGTLTNKDTGTVGDVGQASSSEGYGGSDTTTRNYGLTRTGNIGVTTNQQMATDEFDFWTMFRSYFTTVVYPDLDELLTLKVY